MTHPISNVNFIFSTNMLSFGITLFPGFRMSVGKVTLPCLAIANLQLQVRIINNLMLQVVRLRDIL